MSEEGYT